MCVRSRSSCRSTTELHRGRRPRRLPIGSVTGADGICFTAGALSCLRQLSCCSSWAFCNQRPCGHDASAGPIEPLGGRSSTNYHLGGNQPFRRTCRKRNLVCKERRVLGNRRARGVASEDLAVGRSGWIPRAACFTTHDSIEKPLDGCLEEQLAVGECERFR